MLADTMREPAPTPRMFGRYALDEPGSILANQGETLDDYLRRIPELLFPADGKNVIPGRRRRLVRLGYIACRNDSAPSAHGLRNGALRGNLTFVEEGAEHKEQAELQHPRLTSSASSTPTT